MRSMSRQIKKLLSVGDVVFSAQGGREMVVRKIYNDGFETDEDFFSYGEVRKLYWLTRYGYNKRRERWRSCGST